MWQLVVRAEMASYKPGWKNMKYRVLRGHSENDGCGPGSLVVDGCQDAWQ